MTDLTAIYNLRTSIEENIRTVFTAAGFAALTRQNQPQQFQQTTPRVEIKVDIGPATGRRHYCPDGKLRFDAWTVQFGVQCITRPSAVDGQNTQHDLYVGQVRSFMSELGGETNFSDSGNFPNHYLAEPVRDSGSPNTLKAEDGVEYTILGYTGIVCVRKSAWPSS